MQLLLERRHRHEEVLVEPLRQLVEHLAFLAAQKDRFERLADLVQLRVADDFAVIVANLVGFEQAKGRAQAKAIDELHDGDEFFEPIFQRRPRQDDGVRRVDLFDAAGHARGPVLDALRLVEDHQVWPPVCNQLQIGVNAIVIHDLDVCRQQKLARTLRPQAADYLGLAFTESFDLALTLVLERRRADWDEDAARRRNAGTSNLDGGDRLDGLAQAHLVADQAAARPRGEQRPLGLVVVERHLEELLEIGALDSLGIFVFKDLLAPRQVAPLRDRPQHIVPAAQIGIDRLRFGQERIKERDRQGQENALVAEIALRSRISSFGQSEPARKQMSRCLP